MPSAFLIAGFSGSPAGRGLGELLAILEAAERHRLRHFLALAHDDHVDGLADRRLAHDARQILALLHVDAVELQDHVAGLDAGRLGRALVVDAGDQRAARRAEAEALGDVVVDVLDAHAEPAAARLAELAGAGRSPAWPAMAGTAKPMPIEPPEGDRIAVLMPITSPSMLNSGPPELPG